MAQVISFPRSAAPARQLTRPQVSGLMRIVERIRYRHLLACILLTAPDRVLQDAGLTREQVRQEIAKPFWRA